MTQQKQTKFKVSQLNPYISLFIKRYTLSLSIISVAMSVLAGSLIVFNNLSQDQAQAVVAESVAINSITQDSTDFLVDFTTTNYTNDLQGTHTHFYFDTESNTATNKMYYGASPYVLDTSTIPQGATQLCAIVADVSHTPLANSGNCFTLPAVVAEPPAITSSNITSLITNFSCTPTSLEASALTTCSGQIPSGYRMILNSDTTQQFYSYPTITVGIDDGTYNNEPSAFVSNCDFAQSSKTTSGTRIYVDGPAEFTCNGLNVGYNTGEKTVKLAIVNTDIGFVPPLSSDFQNTTQVITVTDACIPDPCGPNQCNNVQTQQLNLTCSIPSVTAAISTITTDGTGDQYIVNFTTTGFDNSLTGDHTRFYYNTEDSTVTNKEFFGTSPYLLDTSTKPANATQLCIIVASGAGSVYSNTGNCVTLPALPTPDCSATPNAEGCTPISINPNIAITGITINGTNISVAYSPVEFAFPSTNPKARFYFNTEANTVTNKEVTTASPYSIAISSIPATATQLCVVLVSTTGIMPNTGNCYNIPALPTTPNNPTTNTAPFLLNSATQRLTAVLTPSKTTYAVGEAIRLDVQGIKNSNGTNAVGVNCLFNISFTPAGSTQAQSIQITKTTDSTGSCFTAIATNGRISTLPGFAINTYALTAGDTTTLLNQNGVGTAQVNVVGSNGQTYSTNSATFTVGTVATGDLARTGGLGISISIIVAAVVIGSIAYSSDKSINSKKTKLK